jgi:hypothetical protein
MFLTRFVYISVDSSKAPKAKDIWKNCSLLMIKQKGCISEKLLRSATQHEFISYSE